MKEIMRSNWLCFIPKSECSNIHETKLVMLHS